MMAWLVAEMNAGDREEPKCNRLRVNNDRVLFLMKVHLHVKSSEWSEYIIVQDNS